MTPILSGFAFQSHKPSVRARNIFPEFRPFCFDTIDRWPREERRKEEWNERALAEAKTVYPRRKSGLIRTPGRLFKMHVNEMDCRLYTKWVTIKLCVYIMIRITDAWFRVFRVWL